MMYILIGILILILLYFVFTYNKLVKLNNNVDEAFATMDVYLKKRWDLIPNIVETVKGYANHEKDTLEKIISLRNSVYDDLSQSDKLKTNKEVNQNISRLMALAESYPELKANENFLNLSKELTQIEDEIAQSRKYFNAVVRLFNNKVEMFPSNIVAKLISYKTKEMFVASENERVSVKVDL